MKETNIKLYNELIKHWGACKMVMDRAGVSKNWFYQVMKYSDNDYHDAKITQCSIDVIKELKEQRQTLEMNAQAVLQA